MSSTFLPILSDIDVAQAVQLIQQANAPNLNLPPDQQRALQQQVFELQRRPEAWGLIVPFLAHNDTYVQFYGAHTAQVKIARDWATFPADHGLQLRDLLLSLTCDAILAGRDKFIVRKLFITITALALRLASLSPSDDIHWPRWIVHTTEVFSSRVIATPYMLEFLEIASEEIARADLIGPQKSRLQESLNEATPMVVHVITGIVDMCDNTSQQPTAANASELLVAALKCLEAWLHVLPADQITPLLPALISLLNPVVNTNGGIPEFEDRRFVAASDVLQEILTTSALASGGAGSKTLTEPLLMWINSWGQHIVRVTLQTGEADDVSHSFCKLLVSLGDHSTSYIASNIASSAPIQPSGTSISGSPPQRGHLVQSYLRILLAYTSLPGYYGVDEEESELTLGFWYLFQEALWSLDNDDSDDEAFVNGRPTKQEQDQWTVAKAVYVEVVRVLRQKVVWPNALGLSSWTKDAKDKFKVYRRDVGDALINAYYVLRNEMLGYYVSDLLERLSTKRDEDGWEDVEGTLHCIMSIQEAVPVEENMHLSQLFGPEILGRLPTSGHDRVRLTTVGLIGDYASWFTKTPTPPPGATVPSLLMNAIRYIASALPEQALCLSAANALRDLCDANRVALAPHIAAFAELHANIARIPATERSKVLQSIASIIQALPPEDEIAPVEGLVGPEIDKLRHALQETDTTESTRQLVIEQLHIVTGVSNGLTRSSDPIFALDYSPELNEEEVKMAHAREDARMIKLREDILNTIYGALGIWSTDALVSDALSDMIKAITSLPLDATLLSLLPGPLLELVCQAAKKQLTAVWLSLASMLIVQLDPPTLLPPVVKSGPNSEAEETILRALPVLLEAGLSSLSQPGAMESNPDIVQAFFGCMEQISQHFVSAFYRLPLGALDSLLHCAISSLMLQERYSLVSACTFLGSLIIQTAVSDRLGEMKNVLVQAYGKTILRGLLSGFAGVAPRSATPNLVELLMTLFTRFPAESRGWAKEILSSEDFIESKATPEAKEKFAQALSGPRSNKRIREAAQQFTLVARGLDGSSFGFATVTV